MADISDELVRTVTVVEKYGIRLSRGSSVIVGRIKNDQGVVLIFVNNAGVETKFAISRDAAEALRALLPAVLGPVTKSMLAWASVEPEDLRIE